MKKAVALLLASSAPFWAAAETVVADEAAALAASPFRSVVIADSLKGILIVGSWSQVKKNPECRDGVYAEGVRLMADDPSILSRLAGEFIGRPLTQDTLGKIKSDIAAFYCDQGQPFVLVSIPKQNPKCGVLQVVVDEAVLGNITVRGNKNFTPERLRGFIRGKPGTPIDGKQLVQDMARMNQNPFRRTDAIIRPGKKPGVADLELATIDRWPYRFYMGADNTGTIATERDRFFFGFNFGKTIVEDSEISYQFTCSPNWNRFISQTALCRIPFPARQTFIFYGGYTQVEPELANTDDSEKSKCWQVDGRYRIPIITNTSFLQEFLIGFDYKQVIARIKRHNVEVFHDNVSIDQFMIGYDLGHRGLDHKVTLVAEIYGSPGGMSYGNTTKRFQIFRPGASSQYVYGKLSHSFAYRFNDFWLSYDLNGQLSSKNLLPSEQFTLSGYYAVRGFEERVVNVDNALLFNFAIETPRISIGKLAGWSRRSFDELYFLGFFDFGYGGNTNPLIGESRTVSLGSIGPGVRYQIDRYVTARFDYGFQLWHHGFSNPTDSRYNFGLIVSF